MMVVALIITIRFLFWCVFITESHCEIANSTICGSLADIFGFFRLKNALNLVNCLIIYLQKACRTSVKIFMQRVESNHNYYYVPKVPPWGYCCLKVFVKVFYLCEYLHYQLFIPF